jgi:hypothetical protein
MTLLLHMLLQGKTLSLSLISMATCYLMSCVLRLTKLHSNWTSLLPTLLNGKALPSNTGYRNTNFSHGRRHGRGQGPSQQYSFSSPSQRPICQVCHKPGHTATPCGFRFEQGSQAKNSPMNANLVYVPSASDSQWYPDTGSNVHLTNELSNLNMHAEDYTSTDQIWVGNGQGLHISNSGRGLLPTPSCNFHLFSLLCSSNTEKTYLC